MSLDGILCVDKPEDFTSFDVIAKLRGMARTKRVGHAGTLDPMATGVLPVFFGRAAKAVDLLPNHDKIYLAGLMLGIATDTQDNTGTVLAKKRHNVTAQQFAAALSGFLGEQDQVPPMMSAVRVNGQRLYDLARQGIEIERKPRRITVYDIVPVEADEESGCYTVRVACSRGTYVRTLCHDLGETLGCGAVMTSLRREAACGYTLSDCLTLEKIQSLVDAGDLGTHILPVASAFSDLPALALNERQARHFCCGLGLGLSQLGQVPAGRLAVYNGGERFLGLAEADFKAGVLRIIKLLLPHETPG